MMTMPDHTETSNGLGGGVASLRFIVIAMLMIFGLSLLTPPASAQSLDAARASGMVGERFDGYAVARESATPAVRQMVDRVNRERGDIYARRAREQKISPDQVGKFYAAQIVAKAPAGTWVLSSTGVWSRK